MDSEEPDQGTFHKDRPLSMGGQISGQYFTCIASPAQLANRGTPLSCPHYNSDYRRDFCTFFQVKIQGIKRRGKITPLSLHA